MPRPICYVLLLAASAAGAQTLLENDQVRVLKAVDKPHTPTKPHDHKVNRVMVYLTAGKQQFTMDGKTTVKDWKAGQAVWSPAAGVHVGEVLSANNLEIVEVEIKKPADPSKSPKTALDPVAIDKKHYKVEFENPQVRVFRVHFGPHESAPLHEHVLNRVVVYLTDQNTKMTADGKVETATHKAGEASWGGPVKHLEENLMDKPFEAIVVELKN